MYIQTYEIDVHLPIGQTKHKQVCNDPRSDETEITESEAKELQLTGINAIWVRAGLLTFDSSRVHCSSSPESLARIKRPPSLWLLAFLCESCRPALNLFKKYPWSFS